MGEFYTWTEEKLGLNVPEMDNEHKELVVKMNALYKGVEDNVDRPSVEALINDLAQFTVKHFADEEAYMEKIGFPDVEIHKVIHKQLLSQFNEHVKKFQETGVIEDSFFGFLKVWLTAHICGIDKKYSVHAQTKKAA